MLYCWGSFITWKQWGHNYAFRTQPPPKGTIMPKGFRKMYFFHNFLETWFPLSDIKAWYYLLSLGKLGGNSSISFVQMWISVATTKGQCILSVTKHQNWSLGLGGKLLKEDNKLRFRVPNNVSTGPKEFSLGLSIKWACPSPLLVCGTSFELPCDGW